MTPPNPNNEIEAELRELMPSQKVHEILIDVRHRDKGVSEAYDEIVSLIEPFIAAHTQEQIRLARLDELLHVYDTDALYFYDDKEDSTTVGRRIKELRDSATEYLDKSVKGDK